MLGAYAEQIQPEISQRPCTDSGKPAMGSGDECFDSSWYQSTECFVPKPRGSSNFTLRSAVRFFPHHQSAFKAYYSTGKLIIASEYAGTLGVPALFNKSLFSEIMTLKGSEGAKQVIKKHVHQVFGIFFLAGAIDIDTPKDYQFLQTLTPQKL